jgi:hypothetical protein
MPGAGSYVAASHIYGAAAKDGTVFAIIARDARPVTVRRTRRAIRRDEIFVDRHADERA